MRLSIANRQMKLVCIDAMRRGEVVIENREGREKKKVALVASKITYKHLPIWFTCEILILLTRIFNIYYLIFYLL